MIGLHFKLTIKENEITTPRVILMRKNDGKVNSTNPRFKCKLTKKHSSSKGRVGCSTIVSSTIVTSTIVSSTIVSLTIASLTIVSSTTVSSTIVSSTTVS